METKVCARCKEVKLVNLFNKSKARLDGYHKYCKPCRKFYRDNRKELASIQQKIWRTSFPELKKQSDVNFRKANPDKIRMYSANRRARKLQATPKWANLEKIQVIYELCPIGYHVDHIIPLKSDLVCGLHVDYNLQYLKAEDNLRKGNRYDGR